jgi:hypothetical protein
MINIEKYNKILSTGLLLDHFILLCNIKDKKDSIKNKRIGGFYNLLCKKGYIEEGVVTEKGLELVGDDAVVLMKTIVTLDNTTKPLEEFDYATWVIELHKKCQNKLLELTGKRQIRDSINNKFYPFLPNSTDLGRALLRAITAYKLSDFDTMEKTILNYIEKCFKAKSWFPILGYYIIKNNSSTMVTDMESIDEVVKNDDSIVNI